MAPPNPPSEGADPQCAFSDLVKSLPSQRPRPTLTKFVKKLDVLQEVHLPPALPHMATLCLAEKGLIGQFTSIWLLQKLFKYGLKEIGLTKFK